MQQLSVAEPVQREVREDGHFREREFIDLHALAHLASGLKVTVAASDEVVSAAARARRAESARMFSFMLKEGLRGCKCRCD